MKPANVLILPGWQNSGPGHWQSHWEQRHGYLRVEQHDWLRPLRGDWIARLEDVLLACDEPAVLVAHSLGCIQAAAWAAHSRNAHLVKAALFVAPPDIERDDLRQMLPGWAAFTGQALPFKTMMFASSNDPFCALTRSRQLATAWGADFTDTGPCGHLNAESGLGDWPQVHQHLLQLMLAAPTGPSQRHAAAHTN